MTLVTQGFDQIKCSLLPVVDLEVLAHQNLRILSSTISEERLKMFGYDGAFVGGVLYYSASSTRILLEKNNFNKNVTSNRD